ncbi:bifunctional DNA-binding transcriptional regulator/O6-methylguanine-DNA methyltransferase Ada [Sphingomonas sp.]|jgi:AraC family transcriptional regulator of adaptative response/methylated-DNA-[protein]-cysteine methyltransferase|uniref:bifunctional DNA-binding transcriptional regulator/O6-methylguanine-DNA methyltransferase Ada n=1 Tax=Sphingomonas sp. TaxID=28214 RepID=UPI002D803142|nr:bifunctional DNA-binding transcriptional regulator/O6-methylguanine-DNA methyltransferase Ada [Sphingomonas sp.]HEU0042957.1 bifunctional DNA-binding transcriptional regulator/O6-methylguanine-DNA methyltransferase Ada [Sphingomonas sp.]
MTSIDPERAWAAFGARDRAADGRFVVAVRTTRIYCKPSCAARRPRRENVAFYPDPAAARAAGFRACLRCRPDEMGRDRVAVAEALTILDRNVGIALDALAGRVGYAPHHFHRLFKRATGVTPAAYARGRRADHAAVALREESSVTDAIYAVGYSGPSRFYAAAAPRLGMTPSVWAQGGRGVTIRWTVAATSLGPLLIAATDKGLCRVAFDEGEADLRRRFPAAVVEPGAAALQALAEDVVDAVESPERDHQLPLDQRGTAFQEAIWQALRAIPAGETRTYSELAAAAGNPRAVRAAGSACGANTLAVLIPCHRAKRTDGSLGGYAYGLERKRALLDREGGA